jgi:hypothetical protein
MGKCPRVRDRNPGGVVQPVVGIVMGSSSDLEVMNDAATILDRFEVEYEVRVISAHRTPSAMLEYASDAQGRGLKVLIAGAGGAAHLTGHARGGHHVARHRRAGGARSPRRPRLAALDRPDASRGSRRNGRDQRSHQRCPAWHYAFSQHRQREPRRSRSRRIDSSSPPKHGPRTRDLPRN